MQSLLLIIRAKPNLTNDDSGDLMDSIMTILEANTLPEYILAGRIRAQNYIVEKMKKEFVTLALLTILFLIVIVYITFRNIASVILCAIVVPLGLLYAITCMAMAGDAINIVSIILPNILFVVGVSDSVHVFNGYITRLREGDVQLEAIWVIIREIGFSTFFYSYHCSYRIFYASDCASVTYQAIWNICSYRHSVDFLYFFYAAPCHIVFIYQVLLCLLFMMNCYAIFIFCFNKLSKASRNSSV